MNTRTRARLRRAAAAMAMAGLLTQAGPARAVLPTGEQTLQGQPLIVRDGQTMTIRQSTQAAKIDWDTFNIGKDHAVRIEQTAKDAFIVHRVTGSVASRIDGSLTADGRVYLINPSGITFGESARVNVGGLIAAGARLPAEQMQDASMPGPLAAAEGSRVVNLGGIYIRDGGIATFAADHVQLDGHVDVSWNGSLTVEAASSVGLSGAVWAGRSIQIDAGDSLTVAEGSALNQVPSQTLQAWLDAGARVQLKSAGAVTIDGSVEAEGAAGTRLEIEAGSGDIAVNRDLIFGQGDVAMKVASGRVVMAEETEIRTGDGKVSFASPPLDEDVSSFALRLSKVYAPELLIDVPGFAYFRPFEKDFDGTRRADVYAHHHGASVWMNKSSNLTVHSWTYEFADALPGKNKDITGILRLTGFHGDATTGIPFRAHGQASIRSRGLPDGSTIGEAMPPITVVDEDGPAPVVPRPIGPEETLEPAAPVAPVMPVVSVAPTTSAVPSTPSDPAPPTGIETPDVPVDRTMPSTPVAPEMPIMPPMPLQPEASLQLEMPTPPQTSIEEAMPKVEMPVRVKLPLVPKRRVQAARVPLAARRAVACEERRGAAVAATCDRASVSEPGPAAPVVSGGIRLPGEVPAVRLGR
jgi:filamentous hemagglutinin family protein